MIFTIFFPALGIQSYSQMMICMPNHILSIFSNMLPFSEDDWTPKTGKVVQNHANQVSHERKKTSYFHYTGLFTGILITVY